MEPAEEGTTIIESVAGSDSPADSADESQLTIRIPNPKVYMARQSQWKGRRGKPRCDHCRLNNLKQCDRVLPTCNHCAWANGRECKYTPLPTPAHRGIPRCDRCRTKNLKCDRNLPICNHCAEDGEQDCNYTPKKRHKVPSDHVTARDRPVAPYAAKTASFLVSDMPPGHGGPGSESASHAGPSGTHTYESELRTEPQIRQYIPPNSPTLDGEDINDMDVSYPQGADANFTWGMIVTTPHIDPWTHPAFAPLPDTILKGLHTVNAIEMPTRHTFDEALSRFVAALAPEVRETATFHPEVYAEIARAVSEGFVADLPVRLRVWASCHHARAGSRKHHLLLLPRDAYYSINPVEEERLRANYIARTDGEGSAAAANANKYEDANPNPSLLDSKDVFERVPVHNQIYDVLVYTHRNHGSAHTMLYEARKIGIATITWPMVEIFSRLCPLCKMRQKGQVSRPAGIDADDSPLTPRSASVKR